MVMVTSRPVCFMIHSVYKPTFGIRSLTLGRETLERKNIRRHRPPYKTGRREKTGLYGGKYYFSISIIASVLEVGGVGSCMSPTFYCQIIIAHRHTCTTVKKDV